MVEKTSKRPKAKPAAEKPVLHPEFGKVLDEWMTRTGITNAELARELTHKTGEKVRRYRLGLSMPRNKLDMQKLADLIGITPAELRGEQSPQVLQSMIDSDVVASTEDEHRLLKAYRKMQPIGQKSIRAHAAKLLERQGIADKDNPYGQGRLN